MSEVVKFLFNGTPQLEYDRSVPLSEKQLESLDRMDRKMDQGFVLGDEVIGDADKTRRAQYVALQLVQALQADDEARMAALMAWLANRLPELKQVRAITGPDDNIAVDLMFDRPHENQIRVQFGGSAMGQSH
jgi:hypothetical protein